MESAVTAGFIHPYNCTHGGGKMRQGLYVEQLFVDYLQIIFCSFRRAVNGEHATTSWHWLTSCSIANRLCLSSPTVSPGSSSCGRQVRSARGGAGCLAAPLGSPSSPPHWVSEHPPVRRLGSGRKGTCPGSSAPGRLHRNRTTQADNQGFRSKSLLGAYMLSNTDVPQTHRGWEHPLPAAPATCPQLEYESGRRSSAAFASQPAPSPRSTA